MRPARSISGEGGDADAGAEGSPRALVEHFFRHEYARLVAVLTRVLGTSRLELVEDVVQSALLQALRSWQHHGVPADPGGWLFRVAKNRALDALRREKTWERVRPAAAGAVERDDPVLDQVRFATEVGDETLRMLFVCCHARLPVESQIALALRTLCGFSSAEIARALLTTEPNVQKRLLRAKEILREENVSLEPVDAGRMTSRLPFVHLVLYLLFNEGYDATETETPLRIDLCNEAVRLTKLLEGHPAGAVPETHALLALMCLHMARFPARVDDQGELRMLAEQDRSLWDPAWIAAGLAWLDRSAEGARLSTYHLEAGISAEHCKARDFASTNWERIMAFHDLLIRLDPSPLRQLNRAVAVAEWRGAAAGLEALDAAREGSVAARYHLWPAIRGELLRRLGRWEQAERELAQALRLARSAFDRRLLARRWRECRDAIDAGGPQPPSEPG